MARADLKYLGHTLVMLALLAISGCGSSPIQLQGEFPAPLIDEIPVPLGIFYSDEFRAYQHKEDVAGIGEVIIEAGAINVAMFNRLLPGMFISVTELQDRAAPGGARAVLEPQLQELQFSIPSMSRNGLFEIWLKYRMRLYDAGGALLAEWPITAYGKSPDGMLKTRSSGLNDAAVVALRDAAAVFATNLRDVPEVRRWLEAELQGQPATESLAPPAPSTVNQPALLPAEESKQKAADQ